MIQPVSPALSDRSFQSCPLAGFSEMRDRNGAMLPHWELLMRSLEELGPEERKRRLESVKRVIHEQGITYNVYGDPRGMERSWRLDPLPMLITGREWEKIERGLIQRATLINSVLADCYGPQTLLRSGALPPALLFAQADFLRPAHGVRPPNGQFLNVYAADIARSPDGQWWVVSDRTQIPTGAGYALANRLATARMLPQPFRESRVHRLAGFYHQFQTAMAQLCPRQTDTPRVVILTPGPYNETYSEQAYLARYLGYSLVEGQDLTVHDGRVCLKTLSGLEPVDVILRRVDDGFCDPLELRNDSILGVPGLLEALRSGTVSVANTLGSGILQSPAFKGFFPGLCRTVLGEKLLIPSIATWWCGQEPALRFVLDKLDFLDVRPAFAGARSTANLNRSQLRDLIRFAPYRWVARERMRLSLAPCWEEDSIVERPVVLRVFLVATKDGYVVMPGALARSGDGAITGGISMQDGGASKDTWVISDEPVDEISLLAGTTAPVELRRVGNNLPSRLADNFFWLGRYTERMDAAARVLRGALLRFSPESVDSGFLLMQPLLQTLEAQDQIPIGSSKAGRSAEELESDFLEALYSEARSGSLRNLADRVVQLAMLVRDRTSNDVWRALSQLEVAMAEEAKTWSPGEAIALLNRVLMLVASFKGIARENMTRAQGWRFLDIGQRIERAVTLCTFLRNTLASPEAVAPSLLESVLEVADSTLTYRSRYSIVPNLMAVYDLVLLDDTNPRSLLFQLESLEKHFKKLPRGGSNALPDAAERILTDCVNRVRTLDPYELSSMEGRLEETATSQGLDHALKSLSSLSETIAVIYFAHSNISRISA
jgi:uncharacterized circularly permuted ATP-grasp superfamily protein/uncharacterized alpha-E superfamily protein